MLDKKTTEINQSIPAISPYQDKGKSNKLREEQSKKDLLTAPLEEIIEKVPENASRLQMVKQGSSALSKNVKAGITKSFIN